MSKVIPISRWRLFDLKDNETITLAEINKHD